MTIHLEAVEPLTPPRERDAVLQSHLDVVVGPVGAVGNVALHHRSTAATTSAGDVVQAAVGAVGGPHENPGRNDLMRPSTASMAASASIGQHGAPPPAQSHSGGGEGSMHSLLKRHAVQVLRAAGHTYEEIAESCHVSVRSVRRIANEGPVEHADDAAERSRRGIGRPSKAEPYRAFVREVLEKEPDLMTLELLRRARNNGYSGGKSAFYALVGEMRPSGTDFHMRFEGLPGEFSQHDFGQVDVRFVDGTTRRVHFFASRLKYSRWAVVTIVPDETAETLVRTLLDHFVALGGVPLCAVFDRPKTVALEWKPDGTITRWNPTFALAAMEIGFTAEVCWAYQPQQKGAVEAIVKWVKNSFFKQRRFVDMEDLQQQLDEWLREGNTERKSRATNIIPAELLDEERHRLRRPKVGPDDLALQMPVHVGPTATVVVDGHVYELEPDTCGLTGTMYVYRDRIRFDVGRRPVVLPRESGSTPTTTPAIRAARLAGVSGKRGRRYLRRQQVLDVGPAAVRFITEVVHADPTGWWRVVDKLHDLLQEHGPTALHLAMRAAVDVAAYDVDFVVRLLGQRTARPSQPGLFGPIGASP